MKGSHQQTIRCTAVLNPPNPFQGHSQVTYLSKQMLIHPQILFYEDPDPVDELKRNIPQYAEHFGTWSEQTNAMHQFAVWTALSAEGLGCNLQHYNPLIDGRVADEWKVPLTWKLTSQLVFGNKAGPDAQAKEKKPVENKLFIHGK